MTDTDRDETPREGSVRERTAPARHSATGKAQRPERVRRTRSGPQIYGQDSTGGYESAQGVIRKDISANASAEEARSVETGSVEARSIEPESTEAGIEEVKTLGSDSGYVNTRQGQNDTQRERQPRTVGQAQQPARAETLTTSDTMSDRPSSRGSGRRRKVKKEGRGSRMMGASRRVIRSPLLIIVTLLNTLYLVSSIAAVFARELNYGLFAKMIASIHFPSQVSGYVSVFESLMQRLDTDAVAAALLLRFPALLFCIGLWLLVITVRLAQERMSGSGFLFMRICVILRMIASCIILLGVLVLSVTLVIAAGSGGSRSVLILAIGVLVAAVVVTMAVIMYYFCYLATIRAVQTNASAGDFYGRVSIFVAVVSILLALPGIFNLISGITNEEITGIVSGASRLGWMILFAIWIFCYRRVLSDYEE